MGDAPADLLRADLVIEYPFNRTTGPVIGAFFTALKERVVLGVKGADGRVVCPPVEYDPRTGEALTEMVKVADEGEVTSWSWVSNVRRNQPLDRPHTLALIRLDGADTGLLHVVDAPGPEAMSTGARVKARWADEREGGVADIACFELVNGTGGAR